MKIGNHMKLTNYLNAINYTKDPLLDTEDESVERKYVPYVVNRCLSYFPDTILHVNLMNRFPSTDKKMQFDFLRTAVRKKKRFSKWLKNENPDNLTVVKDYYGYSDERAMEVLSILSEEQVQELSRRMQTGG